MDAGPAYRRLGTAIASPDEIPLVGHAISVSCACSGDLPVITFSGANGDSWEAVIFTASPF